MITFRADADTERKLGEIAIELKKTRTEVLREALQMADAALVAGCERAKIRRIFTTDRRDFLIYRPSHVEHFEVIPSG